MKILELCLSPGIGGLEMYMVKCCTALNRDNSVIAVTGDNGFIYEKINKLNIPSSTLSPSFKKLPLYSAHILAKLVDREDVDIIHMHWNKDLPLASLAKRLSKKKPNLIVSRHMKMTRSKQDLYHRMIYSEMDLLLNVTRELSGVASRMLPSADADKSDYLYLGVEAPAKILDKNEITERRQQLDITDNKFVIGLFGRIEEFKAQHLLIQAAAQLIDHGHELQILIVGHAMDDDYLQSLHNMAIELSIDDHILFHDFVENPQEWMQLCDCIVLTTIEETFGLVLVEAMRTGISVIGSNRGGVPEIIRHGENGMLFESGNEKDLAEKLETLLNNRELLLQLAKNGKKFSDHNFDHDLHFQKLQDRFLQLTESVVNR